LRHSEKSQLSLQSWVLDAGTTKSDLERALLSIDLFPRAAVLLLVFERVPLKDAVILLDSEADLVKEAVAAGVRDLTTNLAKRQGWRAVSASATTSETQQRRAARLGPEKAAIPDLANPAPEWRFSHLREKKLAPLLTRVESRVSGKAA
jgi:hypothetical protein